MYQHKWKTVRSKYLWAILQVKVLGIDKCLIQLKEEEDSVANVMHQGFEYSRTLRISFELMTFEIYPKVPVHLMDGANGIALEPSSGIIDKDRSDGNDEDYYNDMKNVNGPSEFSLCVIDKKRTLKIFHSDDILEPRQSMQLSHEITSIFFMPRYFMFAALIDLYNIKFFNSNLEFSSNFRCQYPLQRFHLIIIF